MMSAFAVELTSFEKKVLSSIKLDATLFNGYEDANRNGETVLELMRSLRDRQAIPGQRVKYFLDPDFNIGGRGKSRKDVFERNGTNGEDIFRHPNFLEYLWYFLFGARLPEAIIKGFSAKVAECGQVTSGDVTPLADYARWQARSHRLNPTRASGEFYKRALDCNVSQIDARAIRDAVRRLR